MHRKLKILLITCFIPIVAYTNPVEMHLSVVDGQIFLTVSDDDNEQSSAVMIKGTCSGISEEDSSIAMRTSISNLMMTRVRDGEFVIAIASRDLGSQLLPLDANSENYILAELQFQILDDNWTLDQDTLETLPVSDQQNWPFNQTVIVENTNSEAFNMTLFPNPGNPTITVKYNLRSASPLEIDVCDVSGRIVKNLCNLDVNRPGEYEIEWDGADKFGRPVSSGLYLVRAKVGGNIFSEKAMIVK